MFYAPEIETRDIGLCNDAVLKRSVSYSIPGTCCLLVGLYLSPFSWAVTSLIINTFERRYVATFTSGETEKVYTLDGLWNTVCSRH